MKATFTCDECGHVLGEAFSQIDAELKWEECENIPCPNCKLTYGPLTEGMMAEALYAAVYPNDSTRGCPQRSARYLDMARFVLRLLNDLGFIGTPPWGDTPRDRLLDLARKPWAF